MIKRYAFKKLAITTLALIVILLYVIFPSKENDIETKVNYLTKENLDYVYLNDKNNYLSLTVVNMENTNEEEKLKEKLCILIKNGKYKNKIPSSFESLIPENTVINDLKIDGSIVTVDFSKEILNTSEKNEEKMIESIVFSLTENSPISSVIIKVNGNVLNELPNSKKHLPSPLTRKYGINKKYDINSLNNITMTTVFYMSDINDTTYYTPVSLFTNDTREKVSIIIDELKSTSVYQNTLKSYLNASANVDSFETIDDVMYLVFNEGIYSDQINKNILESVKYMVTMSIKENYEVNDVVIKTN